jgi:hypothetical protein
MHGLETRKQAKSEQMAKREPDLALPVGIGHLPLDGHIRAVTQDSFQQGRHFRGGTGL